MAANLTSTAITMRKVIRYGIFFVIFLILLRIVFSIGRTVYTAVVPKKEAPPTLGYGKLPAIAFPDQQNGTGQFQYKLETVDGKFPALPDQAKVYFMPRQSASLFSFDTAKQKAQLLGFTGAPQQVSSTLFRFANAKVPSTLEINIITGDFSVSYDLAADSSPLDALPPSPEVAKTQARNILSSARSLPEDITGDPSHEFLKVEGQSLVHVISLSEAKLTRVNFYRKILDDIPSVTADPNKSNVWLILSGSNDRNKQLIAAEYHYFPVDETQFETYPLKTPEQAFNDLQAGKGYLASQGTSRSGQITIRKISLAYFDPSTSSDFYQPVFVFEDSTGFTAYVPAVIDQYYGE